MMVEMLLTLAEAVGDEGVLNVIITDIYLRLGRFDQAGDYLAKISLQDLPEGLKPPLS